MINFYSELGGTSAVCLLFASVSSSAPGIGFNLPGYAPGLVSTVTASARSPLEFISTGPQRSHGDRECKNFQISGSVCIPASASSGVVPWDVTVGIPGAQQHPPSSSLGYSFESMLGAWGMVKSDSHVWKNRDQVGSHALPSFPDLPFYTAPTGSALSYYGSNDPQAGRLFRTQEVVLSYRLLNSSSGTHGVFYTYALWNRSFDTQGNPVSSTGSASSRIYAIGPSVAGARDRVSWYPNTQGVWTRSFAIPTLPAFLQSFTRETFEGFIANPSSLTSWAPAGESSVTSIPRWAPNTFPASSWHGRVVSSLPDSSDFVSAALRAVGGTFAPLMPALTTPSEVDDWQELGDTAADNLLQTSVNHYANVQQLSKTLSTLRETLKLAKHWQDPQAWANWWLSFRFGDRLTLKDLAEDTNAVVRSIVDQTTGWHKDFYTSRSQSHTTSTGVPGRIPSPTIDHYLKMYYTFRDYGWWGKAYVFGRKWALWPTSAEGWDVIPLSFVVDWIVDVQSLFEEFDRDTLLMYVDVSSVITTEKKTYDFGDMSLGNFVLSGAKVTYYSRTLGTRLPSGPFRIDRGHSTAINVVDGISLIVQAI